jgi:hypothetical protein
MVNYKCERDLALEFEAAEHGIGFEKIIRQTMHAAEPQKRVVAL